VSDSDEPSVTDSDVVSPSYAKRLGEHLRAVREGKGLSLSAVARASNREFKAAALGNYERGERAISVPRLARLARIYGVPVDALLPDIESPDLSSERAFAPRPGSAGAEIVEGGNITIDLTQLEKVSEPEVELLTRYLRMIEAQRRDYNGRMLTIRRDDVRAIGYLCGQGARQLVRRLDQLHLLLGRERIAGDSPLSSLPQSPSPEPQPR
jgi:transcriptional regulator with XRE-family HTH domain